MRKLTIEEVKLKLSNVHGNRIYIDESTYIKVSAKARFIDAIYGGWWANTFDVLSGRGHPRGKEDKRKNTSLKRYGVDHPSKTEIIKHKIRIAHITPLNYVKKRLLNIYGDTVKIDESTYIDITTKAKFTHSKYGEWFSLPDNVMRGHTHPDESNYVKSIKKTIPLMKVVNQLYLKYENSIRIDEESYSGSKSVCRFIDIDFGDWFATPYSVLRGGVHPSRTENKKRNTFMTNYGVTHPSKNKEIAMKMARNQSKSSIKKHWKTNEELVCVGSYESKSVDYLNLNKIKFDWQPKTFTMPDGKTYRPDLFLINENKWIEIKGYFRKDAQLKWDWFQSIMPNSELWDKKNLKEMGIL